MNFEVRLLLSMFACFRIAQLIALDDGPFNIFSRFRAYLGVKASKSEGYTVVKSMADLVNCPYCLGVWASILMTFLVLRPTTPGDLFMLLLSISGAQAFLQGIVDKKV